MRARPLIIAAGLSLCGLAQAAGGAAVQAPAPVSGYKPLPLAECLDPDRARGWTQLDNGDLMVDAGRYKYRVKIASACTALGYSNILGFRGDPISGRVCGNIRDAVLTRDYPCKIESLQRLSKEEYDAVLKADQQARKDRKTRKAKEKAAAKSE